MNLPGPSWPRSTGGREASRPAPADDIRRLVVANGHVDVVAIEKHLARLADIGTGDPAQLSKIEIQQVCLALSLHYARTDRT